MKLFDVFLMLFLHILDDFVLQSAFLVNCKQKSWWEKNAPQPEYRYDYIIGLLWHAFSWTFMMMLPISYRMEFNINWMFILWFVVNWILHMIIDDLKANRHAINLIADQFIHAVQVVGTFLVFFDFFRRTLL